jgi:hypothetical protein
MRNWEEIKLDGSDHYKTGSIEPIDLYRSITLHDSVTAIQCFALCNIIKYAYRCVTKGVTEKDLEKIIHYAEIAGAANIEK